MTHFKSGATTYVWKELYPEMTFNPNFEYEELCACIYGLLWCTWRARGRPGSGSLAEVVCCKIAGPLLPCPEHAGHFIIILCNVQAGRCTWQ